jgi:hypothetical protein
MLPLMGKPILGVIRGKHANFQKKILIGIANTLSIDMKIVNYNKHGTDELIYFVVDSPYKSVCFLSVANISKTFLFSLRFVHEVQMAGIAIYIVNDLEQPTNFLELNKEQYQQLWEDFRDDWKRIEIGTSWWKSYYKEPDK